MVFGHLKYSERFHTLNKRFIKAFTFLKNPELPHLEEGRYPIDGEECYASIFRTEGRGKANVQLEAHRRYIDIQYTISGTDLIGWKYLGDCTKALHGYHEDKDIIFYNDEPSTYLYLRPNEFMILFPEDVHAPLSTDGRIHKVVVKVAVR